MTLSDLSVRRPVLAIVLSLIIIAFGAIAFTTLPLRELPDVDQPVVSINTSYPGASAQVVETQITRIIEDQLSGIEGVDVINATSRDGPSSINIEFTLDRDLEDAANDVRNAVSRARGNLPADVLEPVISKADSDASAIMWFSLNSDRLDTVELSDFAQRYIVDRLGVINGVANVQIGGDARRALRIWLDTNALAARGLTVQDVETALRAQNLDLPAGFGFEWTDLALQEKLAGNTAPIAFGLAVAFVFLVLAAQYESWSLPLVIVLIVPMGILSALFGVWLSSFPPFMQPGDLNIFTQIALVVLVGLACKNAILIVEFAKELEDRGEALLDAIVHACRMRLRPILMTSIAFCAGVVSLIVGSGDGSEMRQAMGIAVFSGMLGVTAFGIFLTPVFYVLLRSRRARRRAAAASATASTEGGQHV